MVDLRLAYLRHLCAVRCVKRRDHVELRHSLGRGAYMAAVLGVFDVSLYHEIADFPNLGISLTPER